MKILVIDNNVDLDSWGSKEIVRAITEVSENEIHVRRGPHHDLPTSPRSYHRIIVSGSASSCISSSPWVLSLLDFIREAHKLEIPYFGICFGHQLLARALGEDLCVGVVPEEEAELGWTQFNRTKTPSTLLSKVPDSFVGFSSHLEAVHKVPANFVVTAVSERCEIQAMESTRTPCFSVQFHPERPLAAGDLAFKLRRQRWPKAALLSDKKIRAKFSDDIRKNIFGTFLNGL